MALTGDQRALLRLLATREEGYEDIAALLGVSVAEVRARVKETLSELDGGEPSVQAAAPPPPPPPPAAAPEPSPPHPRSPAPEPARPSRETKETPPPAPRRPARPSRPAASREGRFQGLLENRRRLIEVAGGLLVALLLILFATGALDIGGDDDDSDSGSGAPVAGATDGTVTAAVLTPPGGGEASGRAVFGRIGRGPVLQVQADGLEPSAEGQSYTVWLYRSPKLALRVGAVKAPEGGIAAQFPLPVALLSYVAGGAFDQIYISRTDDGAYQREVRQARRERRLPAYSGTTVLRGPIEGPLVKR